MLNQRDPPAGPRAPTATTVARATSPVGPHARARLLAAIVVAGYFGLLFLLGGPSAWGRFGVPALSPIFADLRSVTTGWECTRQGIDVLPANPCDPLGRPANYPRIWMAPSHLGLGDESSVWLGLLVVAAFFGAALAVPPARSPFQDAVLYALALCSPAVMLGVERANADILLFALLVLAVLLLRRGSAGAASAHALILFAAVLKLFPIFGACVLLRQRRRAALIGTSVVLIAFAIYVAATLDDIRTIAAVTPQSDGYSYGVRRLSHWLGGGGSSYIWDASIVLLMLGFALLARPRLRGRLGPPALTPAARRDLDFFWVGAGIYVCTYALFRSFDYRLVFLLLAIPQLLRWGHRRSSLAIVTLLVLLGALWLEPAWTGVPLVGWALSAFPKLTSLAPFHGELRVAVALEFLLFVGLTTALVATFPTYGRHERGVQGRT